MAVETTKKRPAEDGKLARDIFDFLEVAVITMSVAILIFAFIVRPSVVSGESMEDTLHDKDVVLVSSLPYTPKAGDIVVFRAPYSRYYPDEHLVKRIIATENQVVDINFDTWEVKVDGKRVDEEDYLYLYGFRRTSEIEFPFTVPAGKVFVMGDNRYNSHDSRSYDIGAVDADYILGPVFVRLLPFDDFRFFA